ncbi:MAG: T9SS type A sorting domain-containing protein [Prevotellaceae bacterium]|jgi:hypothetical protein|nr:T9SS type A sorting domain-containing protein [Prevotellaceae bacterium]
MKRIILPIVLFTALSIGCRQVAIAQSPSFEKLFMEKDGVQTELDPANPGTLTLTEGETCSVTVYATGATGGDIAFISATGLVSSWMSFISPEGAGSATLQLLPGDDAHTSDVDGNYTISITTFDTIPGHTTSILTLPVYIIDRNALKPGDTEITIINYPNPVTETTQFVSTIDYIVPTGGQGALRIYSLSGQRVMTVFEKVYVAEGHYFRTVNLSSLPAGTYLYRLTIDGIGSKSGRMIKL